MQLYLAGEAVRLACISKWDRETNGMCSSNCSSASLSSAGTSCNRSAHVFLTIVLPESASDSLRVVMSSKLICW